MFNHLKEKLTEWLIDDNIFINFWYHKIKYPTLSFFVRLSRVIDYLPTLWGDNDWNPEGLWDILEIKLRRLRKELTPGYGTLNKNLTNDIDLVLIVIDKIKNHDYQKKLYSMDYRQNRLTYSEESERSEKERKADEKFVFDLILRNYKSWWD